MVNDEKKVSLYENCSIFECLSMCEIRAGKVVAMCLLRMMRLGGGAGGDPEAMAGGESGAILRFDFLRVSKARRAAMQRLLQRWPIMLARLVGW